MLKQLNNSFLNAKFKTKVELYILPLLVIYIIFYFTSSSSQIEKNIPIKIDLSIKKFNDSFLELFSKIELIAKRNNIKIISLNNKNKIVSITGKSSILNLEKFINRLESINNFTNLNLLKIDKIEKSNTYNFELNLSLEKYFIKNKKSIVKEEKQVKTFKLSAIVSDHAFIDEKWLKKDEIIENYKLMEIQKNYVILQNKKEILKIELKNDRFTKYIN